MDERRRITYLGTMMRRLLAFLALLTGLAAIGSPAQASLAEALACESNVAAALCDASSSGENATVQPVPATLQATRRIETPSGEPAALPTLRLPVLMGIERAYE